jgi:hypothetical protein
MLKEHPDAYKYVMKNLSGSLWDTMVADEKFSNDAIVVKEEYIHSHMCTVFHGEFYVCKHPTKVKR